MLKKFKRKIHKYVSPYCVCTKSFHEKSTYRLAYVRKINFGAKNKIFYGTCFVFFTPTMCNVIFSRNFTNAYGLWRCTCEIFRFNFLKLRNIIFWHREHMHIGAELNSDKEYLILWATQKQQIWISLWTVHILDPQKVSEFVIWAARNVFKGDLTSAVRHEYWWWWIQRLVIRLFSLQPCVVN
jgi:hypothetical protein